MRFMLLLHQTEASMDVMKSQRTPEERARAMEPFYEFTTWCQDNDVEVIAGDALLPPEMTQTVTRDSGSFVTTEGPFLELRENLGGFYIIECKDIQTALAAAKQCPLSAATEVRQLVGLPVYRPIV